MKEVKKCQTSDLRWNRLLRFRAIRTPSAWTNDTIEFTQVFCLMYVRLRTRPCHAGRYPSDAGLQSRIHRERADDRHGSAAARIAGVYSESGRQRILKRKKSSVYGRNPETDFCLSDFRLSFSCFLSFFLLLSNLHKKRVKQSPFLSEFIWRKSDYSAGSLTFPGVYRI